MKTKKINCKECKHLLEEYDYYVCLKNIDKPYILPDDRGHCIELETDFSINTLDEE